MNGNTSQSFNIQSICNVTENETMDNCTDIFEDPPYPDFTQLSWVLILFVVLYLGVMTLAIGGNVLLFVTVARNPALHTVVNCYIVNLGVCDFLVGIFVLPVKLLELTAPPRLSILNDGLCTTLMYLQSVVVFSSVLTLVATCIERHSAIVHPFEWRIYHSKGRAKIILLATWLIPCIVASPNLNGAYALGSDLYSQYGSIQRVTCFDKFSDQFRSGYFIFLFIFMYFLPLCFITGTCFNIAKELLKGISLHRQGNLRRQELNKRKIAKMVIVVVITFAICWTPYFLVTLITQVHANFFLDGQFFFTMLCLNLFGFLNSCVNPFIYALMSKRFRNGFRNVVRSLYCRSQLPLNSGSSSQRVNGTLTPGRAVGVGGSITDPSVTASGSAFTILRLDSLRTFTNFSRRTLSAVWRRSSSRLSSISLTRSRSSKNNYIGTHSQFQFNGNAVICKHDSAARDDDEMKIQHLLPVLTIEVPLLVQQSGDVRIRQPKDFPISPKYSISSSVPWNSNPNLSEFDNSTRESLLRRSSSETVITVIDETIV